MNTGRLFLSLDTGVKAVILAMVFAMTLSGFLQVWFRYVMHAALPWSEELIRYCFIWTTFLSVPVCIREARHARIDLVSARLTGKVKASYETAVLILELGVFLIMIWFGWKFAVKNWVQVSPAMRIPMFYVVLSIPVSGVLGAIYACEHIARHVKGAQAV